MDRSLHIRSRLATTLIAVALLFAQITSATASLWHHHDDAASEHPDCSVCVVAAQDNFDGLPLAVASIDILPVLGPEIIGAERDASVLVTLDRRVRGPPIA